MWILERRREPHARSRVFDPGPSCVTGHYLPTDRSQERINIVSEMDSDTEFQPARQQTGPKSRANRKIKMERGDYEDIESSRRGGVKPVIFQDKDYNRSSADSSKDSQAISISRLGTIWSNGGKFSCSVFTKTIATGLPGASLPFLE